MAIVVPFGSGARAQAELATVPEASISAEPPPEHIVEACRRLEPRGTRRFVIRFHPEVTDADR